MSGPDSFWRGPDGQRIAHLHRWMRTLRVDSPGQPWVKGEDPTGERECGLRSIVASELARFGRSTLTGPVAVSLWFTTDHDQAQPVEELAKAALDALRSPDRTLTIASGDRPLIKDDVQIRFLHAHRSHGAQPRTYIEVQPLRDLAYDFRLAHNLGVDTGERDWARDASPFVDDDHEDDREDDLPAGWLPIELQQQLTAMAHYRRQSRMLDDGDAVLVGQLLAQPYRVFGVGMHARDRQVRELRGAGQDGAPVDDDVWDLVLDRLAITLPTPTGPGRSARQFFTELDVTISRARQAPPFLGPLLPRARMTLLVVPHRKQTHRDLDNLARQVLPTIRRHLLDPSHPDTAAARIAATGIEEFQAIELHRRDSDPVGGMLRLLPGLERMVPDWARVARFLEDRLDAWP